MTRLQLELDRLYLGADGQGGSLADGQGRTRALVLEAALPAGWSELSLVWRGVQSDLELPPPAIAVSGVDGVQLWFSLAEPVSAAAGAAFLEGLRAKYLSELDPARVRAMPGGAATPSPPPVETGSERWSAFVSPDLVSVFAEGPWLDIPPSEDGQAALLQALRPIDPSAFVSAASRLANPASTGEVEAAAATGAAPARLVSEPARFLLGVMNDEAAPLALRVEAAKALLPYVERR